jgi:hypothetical protein
LQCRASIFQIRRIHRAAMNGKTFREAVCERFDISSDAYEEEVLWRCFFPSALAVGKLLRLVNPGYFNEDLELIRHVADCTSVSEVRTELNDYRYHRPLAGLGRRLLHLRLSGQRLVNLAVMVLR